MASPSPGLRVALDAQWPAVIDPLPSTGRFTDIADVLRHAKPLAWIVRDFLCADTLAVFIGEPGSGKSLVQIDVLCHVATGRPWRGHPVTPGIVLYVCGEGQAGIARRFDAWFQHYQEIPRNIKLTTLPTALTDDAAVDTLLDDIAALGLDRPKLIFFDTLQRNFGSGDENSTRDMTDAVRNLDRIRTATQACIGVAHHTGKADKGTGRGSSVLKASADVEYLIERSEPEHTITLRHAKPPKDWDPQPPLAWTLIPQPTTLTDDCHCPLTSVVLQAQEAVPEAPAPLSPSATRAYALLKTLYQNRRDDLARLGKNPDLARITLREWQNAMHDSGNDRTSRSRIRRILQERGYLRINASGIVPLVP